MYRYVMTGTGEPLKLCPHCGSDLTVGDGVVIELAVAERNIEADSYLEADGSLVDTEDGAVKKGFHSQTLCGRCGRCLADMWSVDEIQTME